MKHILLIILVLISVSVFAQEVKYNLGVLQKASEDVVLTFKTRKGKILAICKEKENKYLVYRFGNADSAELQFPVVLDETSWKQFSYYSYVRGGGAVNEGMDIYRLSFLNNGVRYTIDQSWYAPTEDEELELKITGIKSGAVIVAKPKTRTGSLAALMDYEIPRDITGEE